MRKRELIAGIVRRSSMPEEAVRAVLGALHGELVEALAKGDVVALDGLGRFRMARQVRSAPCALTGSQGIHSYVSFRAAKAMKAELAEALAKVEANMRRREKRHDRRVAVASEVQADSLLNADG